ncbi:hypothetical protein K439DRAFT_613505 [Ramaria rubella]|nr:hypothetical protein K439DRAFT_613505 [Ramaria rubella]
MASTTGPHPLSSSPPEDDTLIAEDEVQESQTLSHHSDEEMRDALREADELKAEGTDYFRVGKKDLPGIGAKGKAKADGEDEASLDDGSQSQGEGSQSVEPAPLSELEQDCAKARSILNGNIGACYVKLDEHKAAVKACSEALLDDPLYAKALHRRATSNDLMGTWSSLASAEEDYNHLLQILPASSPLLPQIRQALDRVKPRREAAQKAEMGEMVDKLKGLGDSVLGNFGLSTNNFKFEPNGQGGYSINFVR